MNGNSPTEKFFVGWDVGAWNCDSNPNSRDAIVILDSQNRIVGQPWGWNNLRQQINDASTTQQWLDSLFTLCGTELPDDNYHITMAIDTPLGFSAEFVRLVNSLTSDKEPINDSATNKYLYRQTERFLFESGLSPMSAVTHMIGSQATKGMHALSKFSPRMSSCGVWTYDDVLTVIEAYPASCKESEAMRNLRQYPPMEREDIEDALTCALVAYLFDSNRDSLARPPQDIPDSEGWIWVPIDALTEQVR